MLRSRCVGKTRNDNIGMCSAADFEPRRRHYLELISHNALSARKIPTQRRDDGSGCVIVYNPQAAVRLVALAFQFELNTLQWIFIGAYTDALTTQSLPATLELMIFLPPSSSHHSFALCDSARFIFSLIDTLGNSKKFHACGHSEVFRLLRLNQTTNQSDKTGVTVTILVFEPVTPAKIRAFSFIDCSAALFSPRSFAIFAREKRLVGPLRCQRWAMALDLHGRRRGIPVEFKPRRCIAVTVTVPVLGETGAHADSSKTSTDSRRSIAVRRCSCRRASHHTGHQDA